ncbi:MAG: flagellar basal body P-ring protein FlgI [Planctomycetota bacterium]|nr:MAG: flagellar basal body P-ring protein FlgI [Planctomycetota bacterium]
MSKFCICLTMIALLPLATTAAGMDGFDLFGEDSDPRPGEGVRLKDLVTIAGVRDNQLHGVGIVVGLAGTGDSSDATLRLAQQMLSTKNIRIGDNDLRSRSIAMVAVTADLPPFSRSGTRLETLVSCIGNATSLRGGVLLQTFLTAPNGDIYAAAQGPLTIGGFGDAGPGMVAVGINHQNIETVAQVANGSIVEREIPVSMLYGDALRLLLKDPDFTNATRIANALAEEFGAERVQAVDAATISLRFPRRPSEDQLVRTISQLHQLRIAPDVAARVVINARTGTVVIGQDVRIGPVAVSHGGLALRVQRRREFIPDPENPRNRFEVETWMDPVTNIRREAPPKGIAPTDVTGSVTVMDGVTVQSIANALNAIGARPRDMVAIFQALKRAGALHAELVIM